MEKMECIWKQIELKINDSIGWVAVFIILLLLMCYAAFHCVSVFTKHSTSLKWRITLNSRLMTKLSLVKQLVQAFEKRFTRESKPHMLSLAISEQDFCLRKLSAFSFEYRQWTLEILDTTSPLRVCLQISCRWLYLWSRLKRWIAGNWYVLRKITAPCCSAYATFNDFRFLPDGTMLFLGSLVTEIACHPSIELQFTCVQMLSLLGRTFKFKENIIHTSDCDLWHWTRTMLRFFLF